MGIDARIVIKYRGEKPTQEQLTRWSWDLCNAIGAKHFFISDGLPAAEYNAANKAWHAAFKAHPAHPEFDAARSGAHGAWQDVRLKILADIGEPPKQLRRAIDFTCDNYEAEDFADRDEVPEGARQPGLVYFQDADPVLAAPDEWLLDVSLWTRYYGIGYERGDLLTLCAVAEWLEASLQPCEVWYGGDSSGVELERFDDAARRALRQHLYSQQGREYYKHSGGAGCSLHPKPCGLCVPGENRFQQYGWGGSFCAVSCGGCGKNFESRDNGATWAEAKDD